MYTYHLKMVIAPLLRTHNGTWVYYGLPHLPPPKARISEFNQMKSLGSPAQLELHPDHEALFTGGLPRGLPWCLPINHIDHQNDWEYAYIYIYIYTCVYTHMCYTHIHICIHK